MSLELISEEKICGSGSRLCRGQIWGVLRLSCLQQYITNTHSFYKNTVVMLQLVIIITAHLKIYKPFISLLLYHINSQGGLSSTVYLLMDGQLDGLLNGGNNDKN